MARIVRTFRCDKMRQGDIFFSRSKKVSARVIVYATCWEKGKAGRRAARKAVKDPTVPNHGGNIHDRWNQKYPVEAGPRGYEENNLDEYRTRRTWMTDLFRWKGFDDEELRILSAKVMELWCRRNKRVKYDWFGAILSSKLGQRLLGKRHKNDPNELFCTEGCFYMVVICGLLGEVLPYDIELKKVEGIIDEAYRTRPDEMPPSLNPVDLRNWMRAHSDFSRISSFVV